MGVSGSGVIAAMDPVEVAPSPGRLVLTTFSHVNPELRKLTLANGESITGTGGHRIYSLTDRTWKPLRELQPGENLVTLDGAPISVSGNNPVDGGELVYNLEVGPDYVYHVGRTAVLVHNDCPNGKTSTESSTKYHGNDRRNSNPQHNYDILDANGRVLKNGVGTGLAEDGISPRAQSQLKKGEYYRITDRHPEGYGARGRAYDREKIQSQEHYAAGDP